MCIASYNVAPGGGAAVKFALFSHQNHVGPNYVARAELWPARVPRHVFGFPPGLNVSSPGPAGLPLQADHRGEHRQDQGGVQLPAGTVQQVRTR